MGDSSGSGLPESSGSELPDVRGEHSGSAGSRQEQSPAGGLPQGLKVRRLLGQLSGARMCFGEPVKVGKRKVVPVARLRTAGGGGFGRGGAPGTEGQSDGGGGGGYVEATPIGYLEVSAGETRFVAIPDPEATSRNLRALARLLPVALTVIAGVREHRRRHPGSGRYPRGLRLPRARGRGPRSHLPAQLRRLGGR